MFTYRAGSHRRESVEVRQGQHRRGIGPKSVDADEQHPLVRPAKHVGIRAGDGVVGRRGGGTPQVVREVDERRQGRRGGVAGSASGGGRGDGRHRLQGREEEKDEGRRRWGLHGGETLND